MKKYFAILLSAVLLQNAVWAQHADQKPASLCLKEAIENNVVRVQIRGAYVPDNLQESIDQEGLHYGKCLSMDIMSTISSPVSVVLSAGTLLTPDDTDIQIMIVSHDLALELKPGEHFQTNFYAMCAQMHKYMPSSDKSFCVGAPANDTLVRLVKCLEQTYNQNMVGQHAVWAVTDTAGVKELNEYGADSNSIELTKRILNAAHLRTALNRSLPIKDLVMVGRTRHAYMSGMLWIGSLALASMCVTFVYRRRKELLKNMESFIKYHAK